MSWQTGDRRAAPREALARAMGGPDKVERQHDGGKLDGARAHRAAARPGSFHEIGAHRRQGRVRRRRRAHGLHAVELRLGRGRIDGRPVVVGGDDFTVRGGAADASIREKQVDRRADGGRTAHADHPAGRRHRRRRLGEDLRDDRPHLRAAQSRLGACRRQPGAGAGRGARAWARSPGSARRGS